VKKHKITVRSEVLWAGRLLDMGLLRKSVETALRLEGVKIPCDVSVLITDDEGIRRVNKAYRDIDRATDVLSFPMQALTPGRFRPDLHEIDRDTGLLPLGDIVLSVDRVRAQAREYGQAVNREMAYLVIHSVLHLLGYDHLDEADEKKHMRAREEAVLKEVGDII
jgi:probable rRNA maturation factor